MLTIFIFLQLISNSMAGEESIRDFALGLEKLFSIKAKRTLEVGDVTHFAPQSNPTGGAEASYHPLLNTIFLKSENLISIGAITYRVKSTREIINQWPVIYSVKVSTIFHELGHSEMDQFIFNNITAEDRMLVQLYKNEFIPWARKNYPGINTETLFQEIYGYYRGNIIQTLAGDKINIEMLNGYKAASHECYPSVYLRKVIGTLTRDEFGKFLYLENDPAWEKRYSSRVMPTTVYVEGETIDLMKNPSDPFKEMWKQALWLYFSTNYHPPLNMRELAIHFRDHSDDRLIIRNCRNKMWDEFHAN